MRARHCATTHTTLGLVHTPRGSAVVAGVHRAHALVVDLLATVHALAHVHEMRGSRAQGLEELAGLHVSAVVAGVLAALLLDVTPVLVAEHVEGWCVAESAHSLAFSAI